MRSRLRRCSASSLENAMRPVRTSSIPGWYSSRQASAKASQSALWPSGSSTVLASRAIPLRQSTRVPNTSKNSALTAANEAWVMVCVYPSSRLKRGDKARVIVRIWAAAESRPTPLLHWRRNLDHLLDLGGRQRPGDELVLERVRQHQVEAADLVWPQRRFREIFVADPRHQVVAHVG